MKFISNAPTYKTVVYIRQQPDFECLMHYCAALAVPAASGERMTLIQVPPYPPVAGKAGLLWLCM
jgi:hypothetical protein